MSVDCRVQRAPDCGLDWVLLQHAEVDAGRREQQGLRRRGCCGEAGGRLEDWEDKHTLHFGGGHMQTQGAWEPSPVAARGDGEADEAASVRSCRLGVCFRNNEKGLERASVVPSWEASCC